MYSAKLSRLPVAPYIPLLSYSPYVTGIKSHRLRTALCYGIRMPVRHGGLMLSHAAQQRPVQCLTDDFVIGNGTNVTKVRRTGIQRARFRGRTFVLRLLSRRDERSTEGWYLSRRTSRLSDAIVSLLLSLSFCEHVWRACTMHFHASHELARQFLRNLLITSVRGDIFI